VTDRSCRWSERGS